jgi:hypothetical protein
MIGAGEDGCELSQAILPRYAKLFIVVSALIMP